MFLKNEILDAIIDLGVVYDKIILADEAIYEDFKKDLQPLFQIINSLFKIDYITNPVRLNIYLRYYTRPTINMIGKFRFILNGTL